MQAFDGQIPEIFVQPGESHLVEEPTVLRTVLGSCVGVAFWIPRQNIGALCHPMLPQLPVKSRMPHPHHEHKERYVDFAIRDLARRLDSYGVARSKIHVKLFGGADVLLVSDDRVRPTVGQLNCQMAVEVLEEQGFNVTASSLGGTHGVNIFFHTGTGEVLLRRLS
jgi:chemotaxis protein CheD